MDIKPLYPSGCSAWYTLTIAAATAALDVNPARGLPEAEAANRLAHFGENRLLEAAPRPLWLKFLDQFRNFLVVVLLFAAALGFYQEHQAGTHAGGVEKHADGQRLGATRRPSD